MHAPLISPRAKKNEAVKFLIFYFFSVINFLVAAAQQFLIKFNPFFQVNAMFFKKFVGVLHQSLIMDLFTTPGVDRKLDV